MGDRAALNDAPTGDSGWRSI